MNTINGRIVHKGLILLAVPLVFEMIAGTTLLVLQQWYDQAIQAESLRTEIIYRINELWTANISMTTTSLGTTLMKRTESVETNERRFAEHYAALRQLLAYDPAKIQQLQEIERCHADVGILCHQLTESLGSQSGRLQQLLALSKNLNTWEAVIAKDMQAGNLIRSLKEFEIRQSAKATERVRFLAGLIQLVFAGLIIGSALIAYLLFRFFMRGIHSGVQALLLNIQRFKAGEPLSPVLAGIDELALLDRRFHDMADEVGAAEKMKQAFINMISTELSNPIRSTRDQITHLVAGAFGTLTENAIDRAQKAKISLDRLMALLGDLLALQDPGKHQMEIAPRPCALNEVLQTSIDAVSASAEKSSVTLVPLTTDLTAYADPDRIVQVLVNLLSNAIKFSPSGASVVLSAVQVADKVEIRVKDAGRGVPPHLREAIFERFRQVESSDGTEKGGTGLGLPICKEIVQLHGGRIGVVSEEAKGSTFWLRLPVNHPARREDLSASSVQSAAHRPGKSRFVPKTIYAKGLIMIGVPLFVGLVCVLVQLYRQCRQSG